MAMTRDTYDGNAKANSDNKAARFRRFPRLFDMTISDGQQWQQPQKKNIRACLSFFFLVFTESSTSKAHTQKKKSACYKCEKSESFAVASKKTRRAAAPCGLSQTRLHLPRWTAALADSLVVGTVPQDFGRRRGQLPSMRH